jgi:hypothetical protein
MDMDIGCEHEQGAGEDERHLRLEHSVGGRAPRLGALRRRRVVRRTVGGSVVALSAGGTRTRQPGRLFEFGACSTRRRRAEEARSSGRDRQYRVRVCADAVGFVDSAAECIRAHIGDALDDGADVVQRDGIGDGVDGARERA